MYKYGLMSLLYTGNYTKEDVGFISHAKDLGFDGVEIHLGSPDTVPVEETKNAMKEPGMEANFAVTLTEDTNAVSKDAGVRKKGVDFFKKCVDVAHAISGSGCGIGGVNYAAWGYFTGTARTEQEWEWAVANFKEVARYANDKGVALNVEPVNRFDLFYCFAKFNSIHPMHFYIG